LRAAVEAALLFVEGPMQSDENLFDKMLSKRGGDPVLLQSLEATVQRWAGHHPQYTHNNIGLNKVGLGRVSKTLKALECSLRLLHKISAP
jgi:hypothetical protein